MRVIASVLQKIVILFIFLSSGGFLYAQSIDSRLLQRADEAFNTEKWKSANTLYDLLLKDSTDYTPSVPKAVFSGMMAADSVSLLRVDYQIEKHKVRTDSLLEDLSRLCISRRSFDVYEDLLRRMRTGLPDKYTEYTFNILHYRFLLRQPDDILRIIAEEEEREPTNMVWQHYKAKAFQMQGEMNAALEVYKEIYHKDPFDYEAVVFIGNYYYLRGKNRLRELKESYDKISAPTSAEYTNFKQEQAMILSEYYAPALEKLEVAYALRPNQTLQNSLYEIYTATSDTKKAALLKGDKRRR